ncbi:MAG: glycerophosphodiester phosphodiesterase [Bacilli bacterium]|nr:glycerophosphodiester phosphodiesterase [Bacilli bacterium]
MKDLSFLEEKAIAHRGIHDNKEIAENSISAFKECIKEEVPIELDIHLLKDNEIVVIHDDNLKRLTRMKKRLKDLTYDQIKDLKLLDTDDKIPTLKEVLELVDGKVPLIIELKYDNPPSKLEKEVVKLLDHYKGPFAVKSFHPLIVYWFKKNRPEYIRGLLVPSNGEELKRKILHSMILSRFADPDFISVDIRRNNRKILNKNIPVLGWTIKSQEEYDFNEYKYRNLIVDDYKKLKRNTK